MEYIIQFKENIFNIYEILCGYIYKCYNLEFLSVLG